MTTPQEQRHAAEQRLVQAQLEKMRNPSPQDQGAIYMMLWYHNNLPDEEQERIEKERRNEQ